jgi:DNA-binding PadR family transcriptional regulator
MKVVVTGDFREPILLDTDKATGLLICSDEGRPNVIYRIVGKGRAWVRYTKGEDENFDEVARSLGLLK